MRRWIVLWIIVVSIALIASALIIFLPRVIINNSAVNQEAELLIAQQESEINNLKLRLQECENHALNINANSNVSSGSIVTDLGDPSVSGSAGMNSGSGSLNMSGPIEMQVSGEVKISGKLILTPTGSSVSVQSAKSTSQLTKSVVTPVVPEPTAQKVVVVTAKPTAQKAVVQTAQASADLVYPSYFYEAGDNAAKFCVRVDGRPDGHLPHLAINEGRISPDDPTVLANNDGGYDWISEKGMPEFVGDWGVIQKNGDIIFFVSADLIDLYLEPGSDRVEINAPATRNIYRKMTKFEDYYVYYAK